MNAVNKKTAFYILIFAMIMAASFFLLGAEDALLLWRWWGMCLFMGLGTLPISGFLLAPLGDGGYFASKILSIALCGVITWLLCCAGMPFTGIICGVVSLAVSAVCWGTVFVVKRRKKAPLFQTVRQEYGYREARSNLPLELWVKEELLFALLFVLWLYLIGFRPAAYGTEKLMDYGFMASMMRSDRLPVTDMWYSDGYINYYYGGQYYVVFMAKLFSTRLEHAYNLFRAFLPAAVFVMGFTLVFTMLQRTVNGLKGAAKKAALYGGGLLAGAALTFAGNGHYIIFAKLVPMLQELLGLEAESYWFSDSTRYIGYVPETQDKTIHEYPSYSFLLGDLHAHVINLMLVLLFISLLLAWYLKNDRIMKENGEARLSKKMAGTNISRGKAFFWVRDICQPEIIALSLLAGIFRWTNFWDFAIYFGAAGLVILAVNVRKYAGAPGRMFLVTAAQAVLALAVSYAVVLPFTLGFDSMFEGFAMAKNHSRLYQLVILWGIPASTVLVYGFCVRKKALEERFFLIMSLYAVLLVILPEVIYVRDIYEQGYARANTMFKFTYQAYVLFALMMSYALIQMVTCERARRGMRRFGWVMLALLFWTMGYFPTSVKLWLGDVTNTQNYQGSDATAFIETDFPQDAEAIRWLMEHVEGSPVVLQADGDSYSDADLVSAVTGLPTVLGWYTHEWLWRNDTEDLNRRAADIRGIYTSTDPEEVQRLIEKYQISYIYVGSNEYEKYGAVSTELFAQLGTLVFQGEGLETGSGSSIYKMD